MTRLILALAAFAIGASSAVLAHGDASHKCKKGYVMTSDHRCVKAPR